MECDHIVNEVRGCLRDIRHWMKPRPKRKQLANALDGVMVSGELILNLSEIARKRFSSMLSKSQAEVSRNLGPASSLVLYITRMVKKGGSKVSSLSLARKANSRYLGPTVFYNISISGQ